MKLLSTRTLSAAVILSAAIAGSTTTYAGGTAPSFMRSAREQLSRYTLDCSHWYVGANLGVSHLRDDPNPGSGNSVDENGPGGSALFGYQYNSLFGTEVGFTKYADSRETSGMAIIAKTTHYAAHLAATGRYPLAHKVSALGKLGVAYNYARKMAIGAGTARSANAGSLYWGLGLDYSINKRVDMIAQFAEAVGNDLTGSADLWSIGFNFAIA